jgi:hypothetical protein
MQMKPRTFIVLIVVCVVLGGLAYFLSTSKERRTRPREEMGARLLDEVRKGDIGGFEIRAPEGGVEIVKGPAYWEVKNHYSYPAAFSKLSNFIEKLVDMKIGRSFPADPETIHRLELCNPEDDSCAPDSVAVGVVLKNAEGSPLTEILLGKSREASTGGGGGNYVKPVTEDTIYLVDKNFRFLDKKPAEWIEKELLNIDKAEIRRITCRSPSEEAVEYEIARPEKGETPTLEDIPAGMKPIRSKISSLVNALSPLRIEDVADPETPPETTGFDSAPFFEYRLFDGTTYTITLGAETAEEQRYLKVRVDYQPPP